MHAVLAPAVAHPHGLLGFASITLPQSSINHTPPHMMLPMPTLLESIQCSLTVVRVLSTLSAALHVTIFPDRREANPSASGYHIH